MTDVPSFELRKDMSEGTTLFGRFMAEVKRRHVGRVAIGYAAVTFVILQAAEIVLPAFEQPEWVLRLVVVFTFLGFPVALALAWIYDVTPHGIERTDAEGSPSGVEARVVPRLVFLAITVLMAIGSGWWFIRTTVPGEGPAAVAAEGGPAGLPAQPAAYQPGTPITSLAVLPLDDFSEGDGQQYFAAGMHEALVAALSQLDGVRVVSRTTVNQYEATSKTMPQIAQELRVEGVVEGSVLRAGDQVRITVQLIHAPSDTHIWTQSYEEELADVISLQREVASDIASQVRVELNAESEQPTPTMASVVPEAQDLFMKGRFEQAKGTPEGLQAAAELFEDATEIDPSFSQAFAALSSTLLLLVDTEMGEQVAMEDVEHAVARAWELNEDSPEAIAVITAMDPADPRAALPAAGGAAPVEARSESATTVDSPGVSGIPAPPDAERMAAMREQVALRLEADEIDGQNRELWVGALTGSGGDAAIIPILRKAMEMGRVPRSKQVEMAHVLVASGHAREAIGILEQAVQDTLGAAPAWSALERAHTASGDYEGAVEVHKARMRTFEGRSEADVASLDEAFRTSGPEGYWEWCRADMERRLQNGEDVAPADLATVYAALDMPDEAYEWLRRAVEAQDPGLVSLRSDPVWDAYRDQPEFRQISRQARGRRPPPPPSGLDRPPT